MTTLSIPDPPEVFELKDSVHVRLPVVGYNDDADARWRRIYNELATADGTPVEAHGTEARTVLLVTLPAGASAEDVAATLNKVEALLASADEARKAELNKLYNVGIFARRWCNTYGDKQR